MANSWKSDRAAGLSLAFHPPTQDTKLSQTVSIDFDQTKQTQNTIQISFKHILVLGQFGI